MLGWVAAVMETESPSQPSPAVIHKIWSSATAGFFWVTRPYGIACALMIRISFGDAVGLAWFNCSEQRSESRRNLLAREIGSRKNERARSGQARAGDEQRLAGTIDAAEYR